MLDMFMAGFGMVALWQFAAARAPSPSRARWRLAIAGVALGLALGAKWNVAPVALLPGLAFLALRAATAIGRRCSTARDGGRCPASRCSRRRSGSARCRSRSTG